MPIPPRRSKGVRERHCFWFAELKFCRRASRSDRESKISPRWVAGHNWPSAGTSCNRGDPVDLIDQWIEETRVRSPKAEPGEVALLYRHGACQFDFPDLAASRLALLKSVGSHAARPRCVVSSRGLAVVHTYSQKVQDRSLLDFAAGRNPLRAQGESGRLSRWPDDD